MRFKINRITSKEESVEVEAENEDEAIKKALDSKDWKENETSMNKQSSMFIYKLNT